MILVMTSSPGGRTFTEPAKAVAMDSRNGFLDTLRGMWRKSFRCLFLCAEPEGYEGNDERAALFGACFTMSGLSTDGFAICDGRNPQMSAAYLKQFDFLLLSGGHVPTQNAFFERIRLREALKGYEGIVMGISAGTMNCAETVYAMPELAGESLDPDYKRFIPGLGLTNCQVIPHYQYLKDTMLDGKRVMDDIAVQDSAGRTFYCLVDGSYLLVKDGITTLYGEAYRLQDGKTTQICREGEKIVL